MRPQAADQLNTITIQVVAPVLQGFGLCSGCELILGEAGVGGARIQEPADFPADWRADHDRLSGLLAQVQRHFGPSIRIVWLDPASPAGLRAGLRHGIRRYPTFIVDGRHKVVGCDADALMDQIEVARSRMA